MFATTGIIQDDCILAETESLKPYNGRRVIITVLDDNVTDESDKKLFMENIYHKLEEAELDIDHERFSSVDDVVSRIRTKYDL